LLDDDGATATAVHSPHGVQQEDEESPQGDELKTPFREWVVTGRGLMAARTDRGGPLARPHEDLDTLAVGGETGSIVDKTPKAVAAV
jgi:hypothetical protein